MARVPQTVSERRRSHQERLSEIDLFRAAQKAGEDRERRLLAREQRRLAHQELIKGGIEIGERRLALIGRIVLMAMSIGFALLSAALGALGHLGPELAAPASLLGGVLASLAGISARKSGPRLDE